MNGQTALLQTSAGKDSGGFTISVERTLNLGNYESIRVGLAESFDTSADKDQAYRSVLEKVQAWRHVYGSDALRERLAGWLQDLEIMDGFDGFSVKPRRYLGQTWENVNAEIRALGGKWIRG